jgi:proteasome alpha subunit
MDIPSEMQHQAMGYDRAATMFSPDGHLLQVEYAEKTVRLGSSSIGIVCKNGVAIVADKRIRDKLFSDESTHKILEIDHHIMAASAGMLADARVLIDQAQVLAQQNRVTYGSPIEPISVIRMLADRKQAFTQYGGARPYGISLMLAGVNKGKVNLYTSDVTGNFHSYYANAIGENDEKIKEILRKDYKEGMTIDEGIKFCLKIFKDVLGKNFDLNRFEIGSIDFEDEKIKRVYGEALKKYAK